MSYKFGKTIVTDGLVFMIDQANGLSDDGTSTVKDMIGGLDVTKYSTPTSSTDGGGSWNFNGVNERLGCETSIWSGEDEFSMGVWAKPTTNSKDGTIFGSLETTALAELLLWWDIGDTPNFRVYGVDAFSGVRTTSTSTSCGTLNAWNHVMIVWSASSGNIKLYLNGVLNQTVSNSGRGIKTSNNGFGIGNQYSISGPNDRLLTGNIGPVYAYHKALTQAEVEQNYNAHKNRFS